ncbi:general substrate transporter [Suillus lakei]|nr:general substrate transporter [Suillus lakei]
MVDVALPSSRHKLVGQPLLYAISVFASLGVFLFGYDQGVMSGIITGPYFKQFFNTPGPIEIGTMVAVLELGALATSIAAGRVGDIIGRKGTLFTGAIVFTIGGAVQTFTTGFYVMIVGRVISGCGVGLLSTIVPIYQSEISPPNHASALACMEFTCNVFGYATSVWADYFCSFIESDLSWRIPLFLQCVIGSILAAGSLVMPESPRWLIDTDRDAAGMNVIKSRTKVIYERELGEGRSYAVMWRKYKRRVLLAMSSQAFAQLAGWLGRDAVLMTGINAIIYTLSTLPPWYLVDRWGRRVILLSGAVIVGSFSNKQPSMCSSIYRWGISLGLTGWWMYIDVPATPNAVVICVIVYNAAFGYSWGPIPWLYPPEIMPLTFRSKGVSISTATNWAFNFIVGETTPYLQEAITWRLYPMHGFYCACSFILVYFLYPETKGVPLEEMDAVFGEEERLDYESERASLVSNTRSPSVRSGSVRSGSVHSGSRRKAATERGWVSRLLYRDDRSTYQPIGEGDE